MKFIPYKINECFEHLYYQIPMELFFNKKYKGKSRRFAMAITKYKVIQKRFKDNKEKAEKEIVKNKDKKRIR